MKSQKDLKAKENVLDDVIRKPAKLEPARKNGKERHSIYSEIDSEDEAGEELGYRNFKRESVLDYFDDGEGD